MALTEEQATVRAEAEVRAYCGWRIAPQETVALTLDGPGTRVLLLPSLHVTDVVSVTEDSTTLTPDTDYTWSESGALRRSSCWPDQYRVITVEFTHGYETWPLDVQAVIDRLAARSLEGASIYTQVGQVSYATGSDGLPAVGAPTPVDLAVLNRYKLPSRP